MKIRAFCGMVANVTAMKKSARDKEDFVNVAIFVFTDMNFFCHLITKELYNMSARKIRQIENS